RAIWAEHDAVSCVHPGWQPMSGREEVLASYETIFRNTERIHFEITDVRVHVGAELAVVTLVENIESVSEDKSYKVSLPGTNVFQRNGAEWRIVHHHASPVAVAPSIPPATVLH